MIVPCIAVCGTGTPLDPTTAALAERLGAEIARAGFTLVTGGLGGVMEAASRGAARARAAAGAASTGTIVGVLPGADRRAANPYCDVVIPTGLGEGRNLLVVRSADAVVLVGGGAGTLAEAAFAWQLEKPLLALAASGGWAAELAGRAIDDRRAGTVERIDSPAAAVALIRELLAVRAVQ